MKSLFEEMGGTYRQEGDYLDVYKRQSRECIPL